MTKPHGSSSHLYRILVDSVEDYAIFALDSEGHVISWNAGAARFKGYTASEIKGKHFSVFYPDEDLRAGKPAHELAEAIRVGRFEDEGWRIRKDGTRFWANVVITALREPTGELVGFAKARDLTTRRAEEQRARELAAEVASRAASEQKNKELEALAGQLQEQTGALARANEQLTQTLIETEAARSAAHEAERRERAARARAEKLQRLTEALSRAADDDAVASAVLTTAREAFDAAGVVLSRLTESGAELEILQASDMPEDVLQEWRRIPSDAPAPLTDVANTAVPIFLESPRDWERLYPALVPLLEETGHAAQIVAPLIVAGRSIGSLGIAFRQPRVFTTEERELAMLVAGQCAVALERARLFEAEHRARDVAENANQAKAQFLAAMSHELRTPLNAIAGHIDLLTMEIYGPIADSQREALDRVKHAQQHLLRLIDDLLNFARIERGRIEYRLEPVALQDVIASVAPMIDPQVAAKGLTCDIRQPDAPVAVSADREKLVQVALNLFSNAVKFTPPGGTITVEVRDKSLDSDGVDSALLCVTDTGIGIPADKLEAVFDPFVQLTMSHSGRQEGTGLGLAISRELARGMGGDLRAECHEGGGAMFVIELPLADSR
ncbi:MAG: ATP-binding protein [Gemmatimonadales bacterium]